MILSEVQKKTIHALEHEDSVTFGGPAMDRDKHYVVHRISPQEYKVGSYALMICLQLDYVETPEEVIRFIETN